MSMYSLLHVSVHLGHPQGAYAEPCQSYTFVGLISKSISLQVFAVLWQHVFQAVVCVLSAVQHAARHSVNTHHSPKHMLPQHCKNL
jgi:hypothetical protein